MAWRDNYYGLHLAKELVRFFDPVNKCPENVPITNALRKYVGKASSAYKIRLEKEKEARNISKRRRNKKRSSFYRRRKTLKKMRNTC